MEGTFFTQERKLKGLRLCYLVIGSIVFFFGSLLIGFSIYGYYWFYETPLFVFTAAYQAIFYLFSGVLFLATYYGLRHTLRFARFTGVVGCLLLLSVIMLFYSPSALIYNPLSYIAVFILIILPTLLLLYTLLMRNQIRSDKKLKLKPKTKKVSTIAVIVIVTLGVLMVVIPEVNKKLVLGSLKYVDYDLGFGFNPPEGWTLDTYGSISCSPPIGANASDEVSLSLGEPRTRYDHEPITTKELEEDFRATVLAWSNHTANFSLISQQERTISGVDAYEFVFMYKEIRNNVTGPLMKTKTIVFGKNGKGWTIMYQSLENLYSSYEDVVERSINSMAFV